MENSFSSFAAVLEYDFKHPSLLKQALTLGFGNYKIGYERLEFLGDRVLGLIVAQMLYKTFPNEKEGGLAARHAYLVSGETLAKVAEKIGLPEYLIIAKEEQNAVSRHSVNILSDVTEAVIAALYLDGGMDRAEQFVQKHWADLIAQVKQPPVNPKTALQEWAQKQGFSLPLYQVLKKEGVQHAPVFTVQVSVQGRKPLIAVGTSKHIAERNAAALMLKEIEANG